VTFERIVMSALGIDVSGNIVEKVFNLYEQAEYGHAEILCKQILSDAPYNTDMWHMLGIITYQQGNVELGIGYIKKAIDLNPAEIKYYNDLAEIYKETGQLGQQIKAHEVASASAAVSQLALTYIDHGMSEAAQVALEKALTYSLENPRIHFELGKILFEKGDFKASINHYIDFLLYSRENLARHDVRRVTITRVKDHCKQYSLPYKIVEKEQEYRVYSPVAWDEKEQEKEIIVQPEYYVAECDDATIVGGRDLILVKDTVVLNDLAFNTESNRYELTDDVVRFYSNHKALVDIPGEVEQEIDAAVMLAGVASYNYSHWLIEYLPRLIALDGLSEYTHLPLLVDAVSVADPHQEALLRIVNRHNRKIILMQAGRVYRCKRLVMPSALSTMPINLKKDTHIKACDVVISNTAIKLMRGLFFKPESRSSRGSKRLFISRERAAFRRLENEIEIQEIFKRYGFEVVSPDTLSFEEKLSLFNHAEIIAGPGSSGFTNILFSPADVKVLFLISKDWEEGTFLSNIAGIIGQDLRYVFGEKIAGTHTSDYHCDYRIDANEVVNALDALIEGDEFDAHF